MKLKGFFHTQKPKGFNFQPRYYNPEKEAQERLQRLAEATGNDDYLAEMRAQRLRNQFGSARRERVGMRPIHTRLIIIAALALVLIMILF